MAVKYRIKNAGDCAVTVEFDNEISEKVNQHVVQLKESINKSKLEGIDSVIPTYRALLIQYNPQNITYRLLLDKIDGFINGIATSVDSHSKVFVIPVCYGSEFGPDIDTVAKQNKLMHEEVVKIHSGLDYRIYMLGFTPGFPYLGGMDKRIETPRLEKPRTKIRAGSVGIAGGQTGIYPIDSPGGWQIIGRTPLMLFDKEKESPILLEAGSYIRFKPIDMETYLKIEKTIKLGTYEPEIEFMNKGGV